MKNLIIFILFFCFLQNNTISAQLNVRPLNLPFQICLNEECVTENKNDYLLTIEHFTTTTSYPEVIHSCLLQHHLQDTVLIIALDTLGLLKLDKKKDKIIVQYLKEPYQMDGTLTPPKCPAFDYCNLIEPETLAIIMYSQKRYYYLMTGIWILTDKTTNEEILENYESIYEGPCPERPEK